MMKKIVLNSIIFLVSLAGSIVHAQGPSRVVKLYITVVDEANLPVKNIEVFVAKKGEPALSGYTDVKGKVSFDVSVASEYSISLPDVADYSSVSIPEYGKSYYTHKVTYTPPANYLTGDPKVIVQNYNTTAKPSQSTVLYRLQVFTMENHPVKGVTTRLFCKDINRIFETQTSPSGDARFILPPGRKFSVEVDGQTDIHEIETPAKGGVMVGFRIFYDPPEEIVQEERNDTIFQKTDKSMMTTISQTRYDFIVRDLDGNPLKDEEVFMRSAKTNKVYYAITNLSGHTILMLPKEQTYYLSFKYEDVLDSFYYEKDNYNRVEVEFRYIGSKVIEERMAERAREAALRDSLRDTYGDYYYSPTSYGIFEGLEEGENMEVINKTLQKKAAEEKDSLRSDPDFFERTHQEVKAVLYRNKWQNKIVVTDITGSMYAYMDQVLVWHALNLTGSEAETKYIFFNDGDEKPLSEKHIGSTGGIYSSPSSKVEDIINTMITSSKAGYGAESPENDIEALLEGQKQFSQGYELLLIADNYSDVRDMELIADLKIPVRVILCGVDSYVNEQYLELAYKTGGSVHTIEEDIVSLRHLSEGQTVKVANKEYKFLRGKFIVAD